MARFGFWLYFHSPPPPPPPPLLLQGGAIHHLAGRQSAMLNFNNDKGSLGVLMDYVYYQPNSCNSHAVPEWAGGTFQRQQRKVPPAHAQRVFCLCH
jgi:hypothetical protein